MALIILGIVLFIGFVFVFLLLMPRPSAAGALLQQVTRPVRLPTELPAWRTALNVDRFARPFTLVRSLFSPEPNPQLVRRLLLAGYRKPAHADIFLGSRLALPAALGLVVALYVESNTIVFFLIAVALGFFIPDFWLSWAINKRRDKIRLSLPDGLDFLAICLEAGLGIDQGIIRLGQELRISHPALSEELLQINFEQRAGVPRITDVDSDRSFWHRDFEVAGDLLRRAAYAAPAVGRRDGGQDNRQDGIAAGSVYFPGGGNCGGRPTLHFDHAAFSQFYEVGTRSWEFAVLEFNSKER